MKAILIKEPGSSQNLTIKDYSKPEKKEGFVLVKNIAFGINRADIYMRKGLFGETNNIIGIECVGIIEEDPSGTFKKGRKIASFVGGMARTFSGSYVEYLNIPVSNIIPVETNLAWNELAAIPETYSTAWALLNWGIQAKKGETLLVRGGSSALGLASIVLAKQLGLTVVATSRTEKKLDYLKKIGADYAIVDNGTIAEKIKEITGSRVDSVIELIGNATLEDSFNITRPTGIICVAGFLGGLAPLENFNPLMQIPSGVRLTVFGSAFVFGNADFPFQKIPLQAIITDIEQNRIANILTKTLEFENIREAHELMESNTLTGKIVVTV